MAEDPSGGRFRVIRRDLAGDTVYSRELSYAPVGYGEARLDEIAWRAVRVPSGAVAMVGGLPQLPEAPPDSMERFRAVRAALRYPLLQPPIQSVRLGGDGTIWLQRENDGGPLLRWIVLDEDGEPLGQVDLSRGQRIAWSSRDILWVIEPDDFDVPWLVRYRIG